jgi:hypothetical protein
VLCSKVEYRYIASTIGRQSKVERKLELEHARACDRRDEVAQSVLIDVVRLHQLGSGGIVRQQHTKVQKTLLLGSHHQVVRVATVVCNVLQVDAVLLLQRCRTIRTHAHGSVQTPSGCVTTGRCITLLRRTIHTSESALMEMARDRKLGENLVLGIAIDKVGCDADTQATTERALLECRALSHQRMLAIRCIQRIKVRGSNQRAIRLGHVRVEAQIDRHSIGSAQSTQHAVVLAGRRPWRQRVERNTSNDLDTDQKCDLE